MESGRREARPKARADADCPPQVRVRKRRTGPKDQAGVKKPMNKRSASLRAGTLVLAGLLAGAPLPADQKGFALGDMSVVSTTPAANRVGVRWATVVSVTFDRPVQPATVNASTFRVHGRWTGRADGILSFSNGDRTVTLDPNRSFSGGETVYVNLSHSILAVDGSPLRSAGYSFQFTVATTLRPPQTGQFPLSQIGTLIVRSTPNVPTRAYGGLGSDFDRDGWLDLAVVNEDAGDL